MDFLVWICHQGDVSRRQPLHCRILRHHKSDLYVLFGYIYGIDKVSKFALSSHMTGNTIKIDTWITIGTIMPSPGNCFPL